MKGDDTECDDQSARTSESFEVLDDQSRPIDGLEEGVGAMTSQNEEVVTNRPDLGDRTGNAVPISCFDRLRHHCRRWLGIFGTPELKLLMLGLDAAGKTTILYKLKLGEVLMTVPTIGFNVETLKFNKSTKGEFVVWDVGGKDKIRPLYRHYFPGTRALIFVVDSNDRDRFEDAREELHHFLNDEMLSGLPLLVLANKQDLPCAMSAAQVAAALLLSSIRDRPWLVHASSACTGHGLYEGLDWLCVVLGR